MFLSIMLTRLHFFNEKYSIMYNAMINLNVQQHYSSLQCHMTLQKSL